MDLVAIGAHPDDIELFAGGFLAQSVAQGHTVGMIHLTRAEASTRGAPEERQTEALDAAHALGIPPERVALLDLGDTLLENTQENRHAIIRQLRQWRPRLLLHAHPHDRHPDHRKGSRLVEDAYFYCHLQKIDLGPDAPPHRLQGRFQFLNTTLPPTPPSFIVPVAPRHFEQKMESLRAYRSQFHNPDYPAEETYISSRAFFDQIEIRARHYGHQIGAHYGEPFHLPLPLGIADPIALLTLGGLQKIGL